MAYVTKTDVGRKRDHNEDASDAFDIRIKGVSYTVLVLADGMGGLEAGEIASSMFVATVRSVLGEYANGRRKRWQMKKALQEIFGEANRAIHRAGKDRRVAQMGTTGVVALIDEMDCLLAWVGDSRAYHYHCRHDRLAQVSRDHSLVQSLVDAGRLSEQDALIHPQRNVVLRASASIRRRPPDMVRFGLRKDMVLLCSDGLSNEVPRSFMERNCRMHVRDGNRPAKADNRTAADVSLPGGSSQVLSLDAVGDNLVRAANDNGGKDNITVVIYESPGVSKAMAVLRGVLLGLTAVLLVVSVLVLLKTFALDGGGGPGKQAAPSGSAGQIPKNADK